MRIRAAALLPVLAALQLAACRDEGITRARVPKEAAPTMAAPSAPAMGMPGQIEAPAERPRGLVWTVPSGWTETAGKGIRLATFTPPGGIKAEATVVALPGDSGGELANVNRWRGQIGLQATDEAGLAASRTTVATKAGTAKIYDFTSAGAVRTRLIAAVVDAGGNTWFFKLVGEASATESARAGFLALIRGLKPDAAK